ncbi:MAG: amino acid ABC transporter permease [Bowdeniella nasicola]|nr:amino acid ABC transporter permease [Bowdeniella nasicola]
MNQLEKLFDVPGPRGKRKLAIINTTGLVFILLIAVALVWVLVEKDQLSANKWKPIFTVDVWKEYLLPGLWGTIKAAVIAIVTSNIFGIVLGIGRLSPIAPIRWFSGIVVEFFRAVPVLVIMIFFYFSLSQLSLKADWLDSANAPFYGVILGLTLYNGSVIAELVRSGVYNLPRGQREAGMAIGLTHGQTLQHVELPQALVAMMPAMVSQLVVILKDTALGYIVVYPELLRQAKLVGTTYVNLLPALVVAALMFITVNTLLGMAAHGLSARLNQRTSAPADELADPGLLVDAD